MQEVVTGAEMPFTKLIQLLPAGVWLKLVNERMNK